MLQTDKLFTGQQVEPGDATLGLYNYNARFCSAYSGTFVSADTVTKDGLNRYAYVGDNPVNGNDPSGRCIQWAGQTLPCGPTGNVRVEWLRTV